MFLIMVFLFKELKFFIEFEYDFYKHMEGRRELAFRKA